MYNKKMIFGISDALNKICPESEWILRGDEYSGLEWLDKNQDKPSEKKIKKIIKEIQEEWDSFDYARKRASEYPDFFEYLDGVVKGDQDQIDSYIKKCLDVKEKYPRTKG